MAGAYHVVDVKTAPIDGQKTGTSGLRKKVAEFKKPHYLANWVQSLFSSIDGLKGTFGVGEWSWWVGCLIVLGAGEGGGGAPGCGFRAVSGLTAALRVVLDQPS